jgi:pyruvate,orthophosphate dikinase
LLFPVLAAASCRSWNIPRAVKYREINKITGLKGTAVNVQTMVYGNVNDNSGTGVLFTRNPANGTNELYGEFLINAQGEDVVAGIRWGGNL